MFGPFLVPSSTVLADESQERTKTFLTHLPWLRRATTAQPHPQQQQQKHK
jgi:hypothetical protein